MDPKISTNSVPTREVEIQDDYIESMETDELNVQSSDEEGEIIETNRHISLKDFSDEGEFKSSQNIFTTGINIFDKEEQRKRETRAKRFQLDATEIKTVTDTELDQLKVSLGIDPNNEKEYRFEAIHMHGTDEMSTEDIMQYFMQYAPKSVEWVNDESCNIVWFEELSAARALCYLSEPVDGMPMEGPCDPFASNKREQLIPDNDENMSDDGATINLAKLISLGAVPPGYWRLGKPHKKSKFVLLRFASKNDRKPQGAEKYSQYYKKYGNPNYGGLKGFISQSKRAKLRGIHEEEPVDAKNPWGSLAKKWHADPKVEEPVETTVSKTFTSSKLQHRLGFKHTREEDQEETVTKPKLPRMRMYADEEEEKIRLKKQTSLKSGVEKSDKNGKDLRSLIRGKPDDNHLLTERPERKRNILTATSRTKWPSREPNWKSALVSRKPEVVYSQEESASESISEDEESGGKTGSKVTVVIKKHKKPTVASTVWSRINTSGTKDRSASPELTEDEEDAEETENIRRPGFRNDFKTKFSDGSHQQYKSPLRIEINNDHYQKD